MLTRWTVLLIGGPADGRLLYWTPPQDVRSAKLRSFVMSSASVRDVSYQPLEPDPGDPEMLALWAKMQNNHIAVYAHAHEGDFPADVLQRVLKAKPLGGNFPWDITANVEITFEAPLKEITINLEPKGQTAK